MATRDEELADAAGSVARELAADTAAVDVQGEIHEALRAPGPSAFSAGCPCGCADTELLQRVRAGDAVALDALLTRYRALARGKAGSYFLLGGDRDDVVQEGMIGVYKAIRDFDASRGASFRTFADVCVTRQLVTAVRAANRHKHAPLTRATSLDAPVVAGAGDEALSLADLLPDPAADPESRAVSAQELQALQRHFDEVLSDLEMQVLRHHIQGKSYAQIAAMLQRHARSIDNALQRIRRKTQAHLDNRAAIS